MDVDLTLKPSSTKLSHLWNTAKHYNVSGDAGGTDNSSPIRRSALFTWPRVNMDLTYDFYTDEQRAYIIRNLYKYHDSIWGIPIWVDKTSLISQAASGQAVLNVGATADRHFYVGRKIVIISPSDFTSYEIGTIQSLTSTTITLTGNLTSTWPSGSEVYPFFEFRVGDTGEVGKAYRDKSAIGLKCMEAYESVRSFSYTLPSSGADTYGGHDVFLTKPQRGVSSIWFKPYSLTTGLGLGVIESNFVEGKNVVKLPLLLRNRSEIHSVLDFFDSKRGAYGPFFVPSWTKDVVITAAFASGATQLAVKDFNYKTFYEGNSMIGKYIIIFWPDGEYKICEISSATSDTLLILSGAVGKAATSDQLDDLFVSFLFFCIFNTDNLELAYTKTGSARCQLEFESILPSTDEAIT